MIQHTYNFYFLLITMIQHTFIFCDNANYAVYRLYRSTPYRRLKNIRGGNCLKLGMQECSAICTLSHVKFGRIYQFL
jgi:hypothetical protein